MTSVPRAKLAPPRVPAFAVPRTRLTERLSIGSAGRLTLVTAPPGSGKSVLLAQWLASGPAAAVAWLTLDPRDDDPARLGAGLLQAVAAACPDLDSVDLAPADDRLGDRFLAELIDDLAVASDLVIVLDDFESLRSRALVADLGTLIETAPEQVHFVVASRVDPALPVHRLRLRGEVTEIRQADLAFDDDAAAGLVGGLTGHTLTPDQVMALVQRTEGWAAGLQMAALSLKGAEDLDGAVARFAGDDQQVLGYLTDEVLAQQPDDVLSFLLQTSVLERLNGATCDAVTGRADGQATLDRLERESLFVTRVEGEEGDGDEGSYRYHNLFRSVLRHRLRATDGGAERRLLLRAADRACLDGDVETAVSYLLSASEWDRVLDMIRDHALEMFLDGRAATVLRWIEQVPSEVRDRRREVALQHAAVAMMVGRSLVAEQTLRRAQVKEPFPPGMATVARAFEAMSIEHHVPPPVAISAAEAVLADLDGPVADEVPDIFGLTGLADLRDIVGVSRGRALHYLGEVTEPRRIFTEAADASDTLAVWRINSISSLALLEAWEGHLREAEAHASRAMGMADELGMGLHPATANARLALAEVLLARDELGRADLVLGQAEVILEYARRTVLLAVLASLQARAALARHEPRQGIDLLAAARAAGIGPLPPAVEARLAAVEARLWLQAGEPARATAALDGPRALPTSGLSAAAVAVALARDDCPAARKALDAWPVGEGSTGPGGVEWLLWSALVSDAEGERSVARRTMAEAVALGEPEGQVRLFLDAGRHAARLLRSAFEAEPSPYLRRLAQPERPLVDGLSRSAGSRLVEPLSERELTVLSYLPSHMSNAEIAAALYVSLNTLKTHLRHVYRKLDVASRREAIIRAEDLRLI